MKILNEKNWKNEVLPRFWTLSYWGLQSVALATKSEPGVSEVLHVPYGIIIMSQIKNDVSFTKRTDSRPFQNVVQVNQILRRACLQNHLSFGPRRLI